MDRTRLSLLAKLQADSKSGWEEFVRSYSPVIEGWMKGCRAHDRDDIQQEVLKAVFTSIKAFRYQKDGSFRRWLRRIVKNRVLATVKNNRRAPVVPQDDGWLKELAEDKSLSSRIWDEEHEKFLLQAALKRVKADLNGTTYQAFVGFALKGHSAAEVASALGVTSAYVYLAKHRVLKLLKDHIADRLE